MSFPRMIGSLSFSVLFSAKKPTESLARYFYKSFMMQGGFHLYNLLPKFSIRIENHPMKSGTFPV